MVPCRPGGCLPVDKGKNFLAGVASCRGQVLDSSVRLCGASPVEVLECRDRPWEALVPKDLTREGA